jgi:hypothetical protein
MSIHSTNIKVDFHSIKRISYLVAEFEIELQGGWCKVEGRAEIKPEHHDLYLDLKQLLFDAAQDAIQKYNDNPDTETFVSDGKEELEQAQTDGALFGVVVDEGYQDASIATSAKSMVAKTAIKPEASNVSLNKIMGKE